MKSVFVAVTALALTSCASLEQPYNIQGQYYFVSQKMCRRIQVTSPTSIICYNAKGTPFYRQAMSQYELAQYGALVQGLNNNIAANNAALAAQTQAVAAASSNYTPPSVSPLPTAGTSFAQCTTYGNQFSCSSPLPEANFVCTKTSALYMCRQR